MGGAQDTAHHVVLTLVGALLLSAACGRTTPSETQTFRVTITSTRTTNGGRPLHCMVRAVEPEIAMIEEYEQAAALIFSADATLRARGVVFPGRPLELTVTLDPSEATALYFFFTDPTDTWVVPVPAPFPARLHIELGENEVVNWSPRAGSDREDAADEPGELVLPPLGASPSDTQAPTLPAMPDSRHLETFSPAQAPRPGR